MQDKTAIYTKQKIETIHKSFSMLPIKDNNNYVIINKDNRNNTILNS